MALTVQVHEARQLDESIWKARLSPSELQFLNPKSQRGGTFSVLLLTEKPIFDSKACSLSFRPETARILNAGTSDAAVLIGPGSPTRSSDPAHDDGSEPLAVSGDKRFVQALPPNLRDLGVRVLSEVRRHFLGDLMFYPRSGKYVETPDNFWTVRVQPRDRSFRFTVRGTPESFNARGVLKLKPDMTGYSSFKLKDETQIGELVDILKQTRRKPESATEARFSLEELLERATATAASSPKKAASPRASEWVSMVPELKQRQGLTSWKAICDYLEIDPEGDSARRTLKAWASINRPDWPAVPEPH